MIIVIQYALLTWLPDLESGWSIWSSAVSLHHGGDHRRVDGAVSLSRGSGDPRGSFPGPEALAAQREAGPQEDA